MGRKLLASLVALLGFGAWGAALAAPVAFYTDLTSAPPGAYVTIWGREFGALPGVVHVGTGVAWGADILSWSDSKIEIRLPPGASEGIQVVTADFQIANPLPFSTRPFGRIFYVSKSLGFNGYDGLAPEPVNGSGPWRDLTPVLSAVGPGDVVYLRAGVYDEIDDATYASHFFVRVGHPRGTAQAPIALVAFPGETPLLGGLGLRAIRIESGQAYWTFAKLDLWGESAAVDMGGPLNSTTGIRLVGNHAANIPSAYGTLSFRACVDCQILGNHVHHSGRPGSKLSHLIYYGGYGVGANVEIAWNHLHDQYGGRCIQVYGHTDWDQLSALSIHDNLAYDCPLDGILVGGSDADKKAWISDAQVFNNVVCRLGGSGIRIDSQGVIARVLHNVSCLNWLGLLLQDAAQVEASNNIFALNQNGPLRVDVPMSLDYSHNGYYGDQPPSFDWHAVVGPPIFVHPYAGDFRLMLDSPYKYQAKILLDPPAALAYRLPPAPDLGVISPLGPMPLFLDE
ncbi:MAG TPA: hypothetical protein VNN09_02595 [Candidatus Competibacteraceae bacterium]|nr:hypothetical protein [Candidatus Competibacteraceae bacterium]